EQFRLVRALEAANAEFVSDYAELKARLSATTKDGGGDEADAIQHLLYAAPYRLDYHSTTLAANGQRLAKVLEARAAGTGAETLAPSHLDEATARSTLVGYTALEQRI